ncbi:hypothetical protein ACFXC8_33595 [Streptomyces sp. NPDC059441]|uniref:hypothetical protein n=1 Tax=Streptomyces sp. NPDC059441 TaxID=3346829 RepID=UPI0036CCE428
MRGRAAATVPAVSAMPLAAASGCRGRTISSACARTTSGALSAGIPVHIGSAAPGSAAAATVTAHFSKLGPILDDVKGRTLCLPEAIKSTTPTGGGACAFWHPLHCFAGDTTAGDTNGEETSASGATVVRRKRIRQQGRTRLMGD